MEDAIKVPTGLIEEPLGIPLMINLLMVDLGCGVSFLKRHGGFWRCQVVGVGSQMLHVIVVVLRRLFIVCVWNVVLSGIDR